MKRNKSKLKGKSNKKSLEMYLTYSKFVIGKIRSKFLFLEILQFLSQEECGERLWLSSRASRSYYITYFRFFARIFKQFPIFKPYEVDLTLGSWRLMQLFQDLKSKSLSDKKGMILDVNANRIKDFNFFCQAISTLKQKITFNKVTIREDEEDSFTIPIHTKRIDQILPVFYQYLLQYEVQKINCMLIQCLTADQIRGLNHVMELTVQRDQFEFQNFQIFSNLNKVCLIIDSKECWYDQQIRNLLSLNFMTIKLIITCNQISLSNLFGKMLDKIYPKRLIISRMLFNATFNIQKLLRFMKKTELIFNDEDQQVIIDFEKESQLDTIKIISTFTKKLKVEFNSHYTKNISNETAKHLIERQLQKPSMLTELTFTLNYNAVNPDVLLIIILMSPNLKTLSINSCYLQHMGPYNQPVNQNLFQITSEVPKIQSICLDGFGEYYQLLIFNLFQNQEQLEIMHLDLSFYDKQTILLIKLLNKISFQTLESLSLTFDSSLNHIDLQCETLSRFVNLKEFKFTIPNYQIDPQVSNDLFGRLCKNLTSLSKLTLNSSGFSLSILPLKDLPNLKEFTAYFEDQDRNTKSKEYLEVFKAIRKPIRINYNHQRKHRLMSFRSYFKLVKACPQHQFVANHVESPTKKDVDRLKDLNIPEFEQYLVQQRQHPQAERNYPQYYQ